MKWAFLMVVGLRCILSVFLISVLLPHQFLAVAVSQESAKRERALVLLAKADSLSESGNASSASRTYQKCLKTFRDLRDVKGQGDALEGLGIAAMKANKYKEARKFLEQSIALRRTAEDTEAVAMSLSQLGELHQLMHEYGKADTVLREALKYAVALKDSVGEAAVTQLLGLNASYLGQDSVAVEYLRKALSLFSLMRYDEGLGKTHMALGYAFKYLNENDSALSHYARALVLTREQNDRETEGELLGNMSKVYVSMNDTARAIAYADSAVKIAREQGNRLDEGVSLAQSGFAQLSFGQPVKAIDDLQQSLSIFKKLGTAEREAIVRHRLMLAWRAMDKPLIAIIHGKRAVNSFQTIRSKVKGLGREVLRDYTKSKAETYRVLADALLEQGRMAEALHVLAMLKEDEYFDFVRGESNSNATALKADLSPSEVSWEIEYSTVSDKVIRYGRERQLLSSKASLKPQEESRLEELDHAIELANRSLNKLIETMEWRQDLNAQQYVRLADIKEVFVSLGRPLQKLQAVAVYTIVAPEKYIVVLVTPEVAKHSEYRIKAGELRKKVLAFREALSNPNVDPRPLGLELYNIMVGPIEKDLKEAHVTSVVWSLDDALRYVPLNALHDGKQYFIESYQNTLLSRSSAARLDEKVSGTWKGLALGVSKGYGGFAALDAVPEELKSIIKVRTADTVGIMSGTMMLDEEFTERSMMSSLRKKFPLVHVASHFQFSPGDETKSFLLLGDGNRLTLDKVKNSVQLFRGVELLTLSACNTAAYGAGADGREVEGFGELAQRQGARSVIVTLWPIADRSTAILMEQFYRLRETGEAKNKGAALRSAQLALLRGEHRSSQEISLTMRGKDSPTPSAGPPFTFNREAPFSHPHYWAPFVMIGNWR